MAWPLSIALSLSIAPAAKAAEGTAPAPHAKPPDVPLLTFYKDNYFLTGFTAATQVKFRFSAQFDIWPNETQHAVHFGLTETSRWDLYASSSPFIEHNYNPELFYTYYHDASRYDPPPGCGFFHERLGLEHESNGEAGASSRSWNRAYGESRFSCHRESGSFVVATLKAWLPPFGIGDNERIVHYLGYGELNLGVGSERGAGYFGDSGLSVVIRKGSSRQLSRGSVEVDARWRPPYAGFWRFTPYLFGQLFTGYGETLNQYDSSVTVFRAGVGFSDTRARSE